MDATAWVGALGILGTLLAALLPPLITEPMRRESNRREQVIAHQLDVYADLLKATARLADNAMTWAATPLADLNETANDELDRVISRARVVASKAVYLVLEDLTRNVHKFNRALVMEAQPHHQRVRAEGGADDVTGIQQRMELAGHADQLVADHKRLAAAIRSEIVA